MNTDDQTDTTTSSTDTDSPTVVDADIVSTEDETTDTEAMPEETAEESVSPASPTDTQPMNAEVTVLLDLENLIKSHISGIDKRRVELRKQKEMLTDIFNNDATYREMDEKVKAANKDKAEVRVRLARQPNAMGLNEKVKNLSLEIKEMEGAMSDYLREYQRLSGSNEIETDEGDIREIIYIAKLIRKPSQGK